jgi:DNA-binding transcriptional ArsR family regulator
MTQELAMTTMSAQPESLTEAARVFQLLGAPVRLQLLLHLGERGEDSVGAISAALGQSQSLTSHHLRLLRRHRLVAVRRDGKQKLYRIDDSLLTGILERLRLGQHAPEPAEPPAASHD